MASGLEPLPVTSQKHDPAWKHCQMYKNGDRVQLKCVYCGKIFKGGGIHRIKEHLAGQKGNASTCLRVQPDVRLLMQESLNGVVMKKKKKQKIAEEVSNYNTPAIELDSYNNQCGFNTEIELLPVPDTLEQNSNPFLNREEGKTGGRKKKGRIRKASVLPSNSNSNAMVVSKKGNAQVHMAIGRFLFDIGVSIDVVNSDFFQPMVDAISSQEPGFLAPSYHDLRSWILKNSVQEVRNDNNQCMGTWGRTGCSILVEEWISQKGRTILTFSSYCPEGTMFLRSADISQIVNSDDGIYDLMKEVVEEVGVRNVLQVITSSEERYAVAGKRLSDSYPTVFWTPCGAQCIDSMLEDFEKIEWIGTILEQAKSISRFIYNHTMILNMMRRYTCGVDLVEPGPTRFSTDFASLKRMVNIRHNLQSMVTSEEWMECSYSKKPQGLAMLDCVSNQSFWSNCILITKLTDPLLRLLRIMGSEKRPAMGYVYAGLYRAKETIKKEVQRDDKKDYFIYWSIIDRKWEQLYCHPLIAAGFYLNPRFFYSIEGDVHLQIRSLVFDCIEKLVPDAKIQDKIVKETNSYHNAVGDFGRKMAIRARDTLLPDEWWSTYGGCCPNLARLAIRILGQTCSLMGSKPNNRIPFEEMSETKNCLEHQRLNDRVFVQYNLRLKQMFRKNKEQEPVDPVSLENINVVEDWIVEKAPCLDDFGSLDWMSVDPPLGNIMLLGPFTDDYEALGAGFGDYEIFDGGKVSEDENGEENAVSQ